MAVEGDRRRPRARRLEAWEEPVDEGTVVGAPRSGVGARLGEGGLQGEHATELGAEEAEEREEGGFALRTFLRGSRRAVLAERAEGGEVVRGEEALRDAEGLEEAAASDGLDEVGTVFLPLVDDEAGGGLGGDAAADGGVDEAIELGEEGAGREAAPLGEGLEDVGLGGLPPLEDALEAEGVKADVVAGLSLGEYGALCAAGVFADARGACLVRRRGALMDGAVPPGTGGMLSVVGLTLEQTEPLLDGFSNVYISNHLAETQLVLGGLITELDAIKPLLDGAGARMTVLLAMKGPSHCPMLDEAARQFGAELAQETFSQPLIPVYSNALGAPYPAGADVAELLCAQMNTRVRWHDCVEGLLKSGVTRFVEIGPGGVLTKMLKRRAGRDAALYSVQDAASLEAFLRVYREDPA